MTFTCPFFPLPNTQISPHYRPEALARIPVKYYTSFTSKEATIPWIIVNLMDKKLLCRAVPGVSETVEYVEASSNLWISEGDKTLKANICSFGGLLRKAKLAQTVEVEGDHLDSLVPFMRAALVHKPICEGLEFKISNAFGEVKVFKVKKIVKEDNSC